MNSVPCPGGAAEQSLGPAKFTIWGLESGNPGQEIPGPVGATGFVLQVGKARLCPVEAPLEAVQALGCARPRGSG